MEVWTWVGQRRAEHWAGQSDFRLFGIVREWFPLRMTNLEEALMKHKILRLGK